MSKQKIDVVKLNQMLRAGKTQREAAEYFGVSGGAITNAKKKLDINVVKNIALENAGRVVDKNLNSIEQLQKINDYANELLDLLMRWSRGDADALKVLERQAATKKLRSGDPRELALKAMAEIRGQLKLQLEIFQTLYDLQAVEQFQNEVLTVIGEVDPDARRRIIERLAKRKAIRSAVKFD